MSITRIVPLLPTAMLGAPALMRDDASTTHAATALWVCARQAG
ncbi:MAG: hypothetical protein Q4A31_07055 [Corynebacterium sp.]|nr:hypothetical protein [Corynebacterium sp.]MDO4761658.1 hypothetical protein [Corynebacterium sp.]